MPQSYCDMSAMERVPAATAISGVSHGEVSPVPLHTMQSEGGLGAPGDGFNPVPSPLHGGAPPAGGSYVAPVLAPAGGIAPADEEPTVTPLTSVAAAQAAAAARV